MALADEVLDLKKQFDAKRDQAIQDLLATQETVKAQLAELGYQAPKKTRAKKNPADGPVSTPRKRKG